MRSLHKLVSVLLGSVALFSGYADAGTFPERPVKLIVGYPPGGNIDVIARVVGEELSKQLQQPVVVENKVGADGRIAAEFAQRAAPDGYTVFVGASAQMAFNPALYRDLRYDPIKDFVPVTLLGTTPQVFAVNPKLPVNNIQELIALAKKRPGELTYATGASPLFMAGELFKSITKTEIMHVPYKGSPQAVFAAIANEVAVVVADTPTALANIQANKVRALAVTGSERFKPLPHIPTMVESGVDFTSGGWSGLFVPAGTPAVVVETLYSALRKVLAAPQVTDQLSKLGYQTTGSGMAPRDFGAMHQADVLKWTKVAKELNIVGTN